MATNTPRTVSWQQAALALPLLFLASCGGSQHTESAALVSCPACEQCGQADLAAPAVDPVEEQIRAALDQFRQAIAQDALRDEDDDESELMDQLVSPRSRHLQFWGMPGCCIQPVFEYDGYPLSRTAPEGYLERLLGLLSVEFGDSEVNQGTQDQRADDSSSASLLDGNHLPRDAMALYALNEPQVAHDFVRITHALSVHAGSEYLFVFFVVDAGLVHITHVVMGESME